MTEGSDGGGLVRGRGREQERERRQRSAHVEAGCDWWMKGEERMKGEMGSILLNRRHSVPKIGCILSTADIFYLGFFFFFL